MRSCVCILAILLSVPAACGDDGGGDTESTFPLIVTRNGAGKIGSSPEGIDCGEVCAASYTAGAEVILSAADGTFNAWTGACSGAATVCTIVIDAPKSVTATFEGGGPIDPPGGNCQTDPCDLLDQCGCADSEACDLDEDTGALLCRASGSGTENAICTAPSACATGFTCALAGTESSCRAFCDDDSDCVSPGGLCVYPVAVNGQPVASTSVCSAHCSPPTSVECPAGWGCLIKQDNGLYTDCLPAGAGGDLAPCASDADCQPSFGCISDGMASACLHFCTLPGGAECGPFGGAVCTGFDPPAQFGIAQYGVCF